MNRRNPHEAVNTARRAMREHGSKLSSGVRHELLVARRDKARTGTYPVFAVDVNLLGAIKETAKALRVVPLSRPVQALLARLPAVPQRPTRVYRDGTPRPA